MNDNLESIKDRYSNAERKFLFADKATDGNQLSDDDGKVEFSLKVKGKSEDKFFLYSNIEKQSFKRTHEFGIVHYLIFYLILFFFIGISTIIIMGVT
ncbi:MAG: hypothetical protein V4547_09785 [Bacteroidota bacterium]